MSWEEFVFKVYRYQRGFMGLSNEVRFGRGEFYENLSICICEDIDVKVNKDLNFRKFGIGKEFIRKDGEDIDDRDNDEDLEVIDLDFDGDVI